MDLVRLLAIATLASIIPGQLVRFSIGDFGALTISDLLVFLVDVVFLIYSLGVRKSLKLPTKILTPAVLFILTAVAANILAFSTFSPSEVLASGLFLIRFTLYFFLTIVFYNIVKKTEVEGWISLFLVLGCIFVVEGIVQLLVFPDLSSLVEFGWDPHQMRIVSSLLDPNFSGEIYTLVFAFSTALYLFKGANGYLILSILSFVTVVLTFSRSSYLSLMIVVFVIGILKSPKALIGFLITFMVAFSIIPQMRVRIIGAITFDETAQARITSWQNAIIIFKDHPVFGIGFNTYRFAQTQYGFFEPGELGGHSGGGTDSSFLLVAATTGIFGSIFFFGLMLAIIRSLVKNVRNCLRLASLASFLGLLVHSQFVNSFFFPQIMIILWFMVGLSLADEMRN